MKKIIIALFACLLSCTATFAQKDNQEFSYNVRRALECLQDNDATTAKELLNKEINEKPKSADAYGILGYVLLQDKDYSRALFNINKALQYANKKDKTAKAVFYSYRAGIYSAIEDTVKAINDYRAAIELVPDERDYLVECADLLFYSKRYDDAAQIYQRMRKNDEADPYPLYGLARNLYNQGKLDEAKTMINEAAKIDSDKERAAVMDMRVEKLRHNHSAILDDVVKILNENEDSNEAYYALMEVSDSIYQPVVNRLKREAYMSNDGDRWTYLLGHIYYRHNKFSDVVETLKPLAKRDCPMQQVATYWCIRALEELDEHQLVIHLLDRAIENDSTDAELYLRRASAHFYLQHLDEAESDYIKGGELDKDYGSFVFYRVGWIKEMQGKYEEALKNYDMSIVLDEDYAYSYMMKGTLLKERLNRSEEAKEALLACIEKDKVISDNCCKQYAYLQLGDTINAVAVVDSILAQASTSGVYYDAACIYSRMGKTKEAISYLKTAFEKGYRSVYHMIADDDMDNIRDTEEFKQLVEEQKKRLSGYDGNFFDDEDKDIAESVIELPIKPMGGGLYSVKCSLNELPMTFILDTGCSDISLSSVESDFMKKNGYLDSSDFKGYKSYQNASGELHKAQEVNIRALNIGGITVNNVSAGVIKNQEAPLLLGQNVLRKFGRYEIDNTQNILRIYNRKK